MAFNYIAYTKGHRPRIGILNIDENTINPLAYKSGTPVSTLYEVIEAGDDAFTRSSEAIQVKDVKILPPLSGRDVLAVGKNYVDHAKEFNQSGYDSSDKTDQPTHPVIFTKRATSIIAHGEDILPHAQFTESVDYEGEIGVIIGKTGFRVSEENALDHVWGYTIINDVSARERQRDHKQFYIGKSPDTFCPMGPIAVPKEHLPNVLTLQTFVNGEKRQEASSDMLIFSVPYLVKTLSEGSTLQTGDVIATGTPVGVGFGFRPMKFLHPGDEISIKITGLGTLTNRIAAYNAPNPTSAKISSASHIPWSNLTALSTEISGLRSVGNKMIFYRRLGVAKTPADNVVFIHGHLTSSEYFTPLLPSLQDGKALHLIDLEGHGLSPTRATSSPSIASYAQDIATLLAAEGIQSTAVVSHAVGSMIGVHLALSNPSLVSKLVLMGPSLLPASSIAALGLLESGRRLQENGVSELLRYADVVENEYFSKKTKTSNRAAIAAVRLFIVTKNPDGFAKCLAALAAAPELDISKINSPALILTGSETLCSPPGLCERYKKDMPQSELQVLQGVGHFELLEDEAQTSQIISSFLLK